MNDDSDDDNDDNVDDDEDDEEDNELICILVLLSVTITDHVGENSCGLGKDMRTFTG